MALNDSQTFFASNFNYQKIAFEGSATQSIPNNSPNFETITIDHNLGYIPSAKVWYDPALGRRMPLSLQQYQDDGFAVNYTNLTTGRAYLTTTQLVIQFTNASGSSKNVTYWYRIYYDD